MKNISYWQSTASYHKNPTFSNNQEFDIIIIGGGFTGVMCAYYLRNSGKRIAVFEKDLLASQTSGHTTAKITFLHKTIYQFLIKYYGKEKALLYMKSNQEAMEDIKTIINNHHISCDYQTNRSFVYTEQNDKIPILKREKEALESLGVKVLENKHQVKGARYSIGVENQAIFHPLKYLYAIVEICKEKGVQFFEHSHILSFKKKDRYYCSCNNHIALSKQLILATRYPQINFPGFYFLKLTQSREHVLFLESKTYLKDSHLSIDEVNKTFRPVLQNQIYGGYAKETGKLDDIKIDIMEDAKKYFDFSSSMFWSAQDSSASRGIPYIGRFNGYDDLYFACGFNKWGMTLSHVSGKLIADLITNKDNPYTDLYGVHQGKLWASKRGILTSLKQTTKGMILNHFTGNEGYESIFIGQGKVIRIDGKLTGVYLDENRVYHYVHPICPHLKCVLSFNQLEKTWDCPCHGSRFTIDGELLEGPANTSLKK